MADQKVSHQQAKELYRRIISLCFPHYHGWFTVARFMFFPYGDTPDVEGVFALQALDEDVFSRGYAQSYFLSLSTVPDVRGMEVEYYRKQCHVLTKEFLRHHHSYRPELDTSNVEREKTAEGVIAHQMPLQAVRVALVCYITIFAAWLILRDGGTLVGDLVLLCAGVFAPVFVVSLVVWLRQKCMVQQHSGE